jgi:hypothetical protein
LGKFSFQPFLFRFIGCGHFRTRLLKRLFMPTGLPLGFLALPLKFPLYAFFFALLCPLTPSLFALLLTLFRFLKY